MNHRQRVGLAIAPLFLRVGLGITFVWAGLGKVMGDEMSVQGEDAVILADLGVIAGPTARPILTPSTSPTNVPAPASKPEVKPETMPETRPDLTPEIKPDSKTRLPAPTETLPVPGDKKSDPSKPVVKSEPKVEPKAEPKVHVSRPKIDSEGLAALVRDDTSTAANFVRTQAIASRYSAADFAEPVKVKRVHGITLILVKAARPGVNADGTARMAIWPAWAAGDRWPVLWAWAAAVTELVGGTFVLCGFLTRFCSLGLVSTIVVAAWLTHFGPAIQSGDTVWGFMPNQPRFSVTAWQVLLWQLMLAMSGLSLFFAGPGALSLDRLLFGRGPASGVVPTVS